MFFKKNCVSLPSHSAEVAQLVERNLAKVEVASSNLVFRSDPGVASIGIIFFKAFALMVESVDTQDLKSCD